jgi:LPXTG-site transpeptidase (sortase) family protein
MNAKNKISLSSKILSLFVLLAMSFYAFGSRTPASVYALQGPLSSHTITYFQGNKPGAVSFTFDDALVSQATTGAAELNARGLKGTFFVISSRRDVPWSTWRDLAAQGHEIGSHTVTHQSLVTLSVADITRELSESQAVINQNVYNQSCITIAYPLTETNSTVQAIAANYYVAARAGWLPGYPNYYQPVQNGYGSWDTIDFTNVGSMLGDPLDLSVNSPERQWFYRALDDAVQRHGWYDLHFHEITDGDVFGAILDEVQGRDLYWIDTFGNIARYMRERLNSTIQVVAETNSEIRLQIVMDASLPTSLYNVPLTIRSTIPASWAQVIVQQASNIQTFTPVVEGSEKVVYYNALPNGGDVVLLDSPYPEPEVTSLNPVSAFVGGPAFSLTVNGNNFVTGSIVRWNNSNRTTTYVSDTQLRATIPASDFASVGVANISVFNPSPGGGTSGQLPFTINLPPPPGDFTKSSPANGAADQSNSPTLSWGTSTSATSYEYCYDTTNDNACSNWIDNGASTSVSISGLTIGTVYYWHVRAVNISGTAYSNGSDTAFWSFTKTTSPPGAFGKSSPVNAATNQSSGPTLTWGASSGATSYEYCYDTTNDDACSDWTGNGISTSVTLGGLAPATTYYWHVRAANVGGTTYSNGSAVAFWSFETDNTPPVLSSINRASASPTNLASVDFIVTFSENVTGVGVANFTLVTGGSITGSSITAVTGSGATRTVTIDTGAGDGTIGLDMNNGTGIADTIGNVLNTGNLPFTGEVYTVQKNGPAVALGVPSLIVTSADSVDFGISITGANTIDLNDTDVTLNTTGTANATLVTVVNGDTATPTVTISGITGDGTIGISISAGIAADTLGNTSLEAGPSTTFVVDNKAPQIAIDGIGSNAGNIGFDFQVITKGLSEFSIKFDEDANDPLGDSDPEDVTNPVNYLLVRDLGTVPDFQTEGCSEPGAVEPDDTKITIDPPIIYDSENFTATFTVNSGSPLSNGYYRLYVCGSTSITDHVGMHLAGNGEPGTDFLRPFIINVPDGGSLNGKNDKDQNQETDKHFSLDVGIIPTTGFAPDRITKLPQQPAEQAYASTGKMQLEIPELRVNIPIVGVNQDSGGWNLTWLGNNAGYLEGTAYPTWAGNTVLTAHVVDATNVPGPFADLKELKYGDLVYIHTNGFKYIYQVEKNMVVSAYNTSAVFEHQAYDWLTLVTCENYSNLLKRYTSRRVVKAVLVSMVPE